MWRAFSSGLQRIELVSWALSMAVIALALCSCAGYDGDDRPICQPEQGVIKKPADNGFQVAMGMSTLFDLCGDPELGQAYRRFLWWKLDSCEMPAEQRESLRMQAIHYETLSQKQVQKYRDAHNGAYPETWDNGRRSCEQTGQGPEADTLRFQLKMVEHGILPEQELPMLKVTCQSLLEPAAL